MRFKDMLAKLFLNEDTYCPQFEWDDNPYALEHYVSQPPTEETIRQTEQLWGYKLPDAYIEFMKKHNGGKPVKNCCPCKNETSWAEDHIAIEGFFSIGCDKDYSLCGESGAHYLVKEWEYPDIGIAICDCPSGGHDMVFLDYSACGKQGIPRVSHVDLELNSQVTVLAKDFQSFI